MGAKTSSGRCRRAETRRALTLVELMLAATVTSVTAMAGFTLVSAMSNATIQTGQSRATKMTGQNALMRITRTLRSARAVGEVTATTATLWLADSNSNDAVELNETAVIYYDAQQDMIYYRYAVASMANTSVSTAQFSSYSSLNAMLSGAGAYYVFWAKNVDSFAFASHPAGITPQLIQVRFTVSRGVEQSVFQATVSPRAQAEYVFNTGLAAAPPPGSTRKRRAGVRSWTPVQADVLTQSPQETVPSGQ